MSFPGIGSPAHTYVTDVGEKDASVMQDESGTKRRKTGEQEGQYRLTTADVDKHAVKTDEAWTEKEEEELLKLVNNDEFKREKLGDSGTKWAPIAQYFQRTVKAVKRKYDKLQSVGKKKLNAEDGMHDSIPIQQIVSQPMVQAAMYQMNMGDRQFQMMGQDIRGTHQMHGGTDAEVQFQGDPMTFLAYGAYYAEDNDMGTAGPRQGGQYGQQMNGQYMHTLPPPKNDRVFWKQEELQQLLKLAQDEGYRQEVLGITDLNWDAIAKYFGRGRRSVQRKYDNLKSAPIGPDGRLDLPPNDGKKWDRVEVEELLKLVDPDDPSYRMDILGIETVDWRVLGQHFGRSYENVAYKYAYVKNSTGFQNSRKVKHAKAKHDTSYKEMAIWALQQLGGEATSGQMCKVIENNPVFAPQLDDEIVSGKKTLKRWKHGVRSALNAFPMFEKTGAFFEWESVWKLILEAVQAEAASQQARAIRKKTRTSISGGSRKKTKKKQEKEGEKGKNNEKEEEAKETLAQLAQSRKGRTGTDAPVAPANYANYDPSQLLQAQMNPLFQQILDSSATAEQLSMLPPEQLALIHQQLDPRGFGQGISMMQYMIPQDGHGEHGDHHQQHQLYDSAHVFGGHFDPGTYDQQQLMEHYAAAGSSDPAAAAAAHQQQMAIVQGVQMGQPLAHGMDVHGVSQPMSGYEQYGFHHYGAYQYGYEQQYPGPDQQQGYNMPQHIQGYSIHGPEDQET